jgi:hypothetical protein
MLLLGGHCCCLVSVDPSVLFTLEKGYLHVYAEYFFRRKRTCTVPGTVLLLNVRSVPDPYSLILIQTQVLIRKNLKLKFYSKKNPVIWIWCIGN